MKYFSPGLLDGSVTTAKLADGSVTTPKIADDACTSAKHADNSVANAHIFSNAVRGVKLSRSTSSLAGSVPAASGVDLALTPYAFWPMIHTDLPGSVAVNGHTTDGADPDLPRLRLENAHLTTAANYDVDWRNVNE